MRPVVRETREVQLGLNIDLHALILQFLLRRALHRTRALAFVKLHLFVFPIVQFQRGGCPRKGQPRLRIVRPITPAAHSIGFQPARNFSPPFGFSGASSAGIVVRVGRAIGIVWRGHTYSHRLGILATLGERCVTESTIFDVLEQEGAAMRADLYHWSVLRCGIPVTEQRYGSTRPHGRPPYAPLNAGCVAYQATRKRAACSD